MTREVLRDLEAWLQGVLDSEAVQHLPTLEFIGIAGVDSSRGRPTASMQLRDARRAAPPIHVTQLRSVAETGDVVLFR